jgi:Uma2 family endonuclease
MVAQAQVNFQLTSVALFETLVNLPEHSEKILELVDGEVFEVPSNTFVSEIAQIIGFFIRLWLRQQNLQGHVTDGQGGYQVGDNRFAPDVAYLSYERQAELSRKGYNAVPPELAVEVISDPANLQELAVLRRKISHYLAVGCVVWVVDPFSKRVEVHSPGQALRLYQAGDTLMGEPVLIGFTLALKEIFI